MNLMPTPDLETVDQQLETHALNIERIQRDAVYELGRELAAAQELHKYKREGGGFTGWLAERLPHIPERGAYQAIKIYENIDAGMFAKFANISPGALEQVAKAPPDVQELIAEQVKAGEIFTAASVKKIRQEVARDAVASAKYDVQIHKEKIAELVQGGKDDAAAARQMKAEIKALNKAIAKHEKAIADFEKSLPKPKDAEKQAAESGGVVLGSDLKFHSGATPEQKALSADYMVVWAVLREFTREDIPLPGRAAAGCVPSFLGQLAGFCDKASAYIERLKEAIHEQQGKEADIAQESAHNRESG